MKGALVWWLEKNARNDQASGVVCRIPIWHCSHDAQIEFDEFVQWWPSQIRDSFCAGIMLSPESPIVSEGLCSQPRRRFQPQIKPFHVWLLHCPLKDFLVAIARRGMKWRLPAKEHILLAMV